MDAKEFTGKITEWLQKYHFNDTVKTIECHFFSAYDMNNHIIHIGVEQISDMDKWFNEFLQDNGFEWQYIPSPVLQFLHELGHSQTVYQFSEQELAMCNFMKNNIADEDTQDSKKSAMDYWYIKDEFAANEWLISFANSTVEAIAELCQIFIDNWEDSIDDMYQEAKINDIFNALITP